MRCRRIILVALLVLAAPSFALAGRGLAWRGQWDERIGGRGVGRWWIQWFELEKERILASRILDRRELAAEPVTAAERRNVVLPLLLAAARDEHPGVRDAAVIALAKLGGDAARSAIVGCLLDRDRTVAEDAILALGLLRRPDSIPVLAPLVNEPPGRTGAFAALALGLLKDESVRGKLIAAWRTAMKAPGTRYESACALAIALGAQARPEDVPELLRAMPEKVPEVVWCHFLPSLGRIGGRHARDALLDALDHEDARVAGAAILGLGGFPENRVISALKGRRGLRSRDTRRQILTIRTLTRVHPRARVTERSRIVRLLLRRSEDSRQHILVSIDARLALALLGHRSGKEFLLDNTVRWGSRYRDLHHCAFAVGLGLLGSEDAVPNLTAIARGGVDLEFQGYAALSLALLDAEGAGPLILKRWELCWRRKGLVRSFAWALGLLGEREALPFLLRCLEPTKPEQHRAGAAAAIAIGLIGDRAVLPRLATLATEANAPVTRALAVVAIGWLVDKDPVPPLPLLLSGHRYEDAIGPVRDAWSLP